MEQTTLIHHHFNNADSFAQAFDEAWKTHYRSRPGHELSADQKLVVILDQVDDHPFARQNPVTARKVAEFRVRLLGL